ncbi:hypothetical protein PsAD37_04467 [Pseudovibrio sp. Ad37]|nr:hypothetical protein PsAD37_04467 [Pseudovibrio sp. Ad37]
MSTGNPESSYSRYLSFCTCDALSFTRTPFGSPTGHLSRHAASPHSTTKASTFWQTPRLPNKERCSKDLQPKTSTHTNNLIAGPQTPPKATAARTPKKAELTSSEHVCFALSKFTEAEIHRLHSPSIPQLQPRGNKAAQLTPKPTLPPLL